MNDVQLYRKGLKRYDEYCRICGQDCVAAKGRVININVKHEQLVVLGGEGGGDYLSINLEPFCIHFKKEKEI